MTTRRARRPRSRRVSRVAAGLACLGVAVGLGAWLAGRFGAGASVPDARPGPAPDPGDAVAADLAGAAPRAVVGDVAGVRVEGRVTTPEGGPAAGAHVRVVVFPSGVEVWRGRADGDGRFACDGERGALHQAFVAPASAPGDETLFPAEAVAGEGAFAASLRTAPSARPGERAVSRRGDVAAASPADEDAGAITGTVVDEDGRPVPSARVFLVGTEALDLPGAVAFFASTVTGAQGAFRLPTDSPPGVARELRVLVDGAGSPTRAASAAVRTGASGVRITIPLGTTTIVRCEEAARRVAHVAWTEADAPGVGDADPSADAPRSASATFGADGVLRLRGLPAGGVVTLFVPAPRADDRSGWIERLPVGADERLELRRGLTLAGRLVDREASPTAVRRWSRVVASSALFPSASWDAVVVRDRYELRGLPEGTAWTVRWDVFEVRAGQVLQREGAAVGVAGDPACDVTLSSR